MDNNSTLVDTHYAVETPEGVELVLVPAGLTSRALAFSIDLSIRAAFLLMVTILLEFAGSVGTGIMLMTAFLIEWFYPVLFEVFRGGATPGKKSMGLVVLHDDGTPLGFSSSMLRNLLRVVDFMPFGYFAGLICMAMNGQFKRLGDLAAGTIVVYQEQLSQKQDAESSDLQHFIVPREIQSLSFEQQKNIIDFGERAASLSIARQDELAEILRPLVKEESPALREILQLSARKLIGQ